MVGQRRIPRSVYGALAAGLLVGPAAAAEGELLRDTMSTIGLIEPERPNINYNERAPLVMPPGMGKGAAKPPAKRSGKGAQPGVQPGATANADPDQGQYLALPPPQNSQAADPQWPKDPEVSRRERASIEDRKPRGFAGAQGRQNDNNMTLSPSEMAAGGRRSGPDAPGGHKSEREESWFQPLKNLVGGKSEEAELPTVEPSRDILTDPPKGYRKPPVKVVKEQGGPVGGSISGNEEADPRAYLREQNRR